MTFEPRAKRTVTQPTIGDFKGNKTLSIPFGPENEAFSFGLTKAKAIVKYFAEIRQFVDENDKYKGE
jgi:hypothetical protein